MRIPDATSLLAHPQAGASWEGMVVEGTFGVVAVKIKLGQRVRLQSLRGLRDFVRDHDCRFGLVLSNEEQLRKIDDAVAGISVRFL